MGAKYDIETAVNFTKLSVALARSWPPSKTTTKCDLIKFDIAWSLSILSSLALFFPLLASIYKYQSNSLVLTQSACFLGATCNFLVKMIVYRLHRKRTQILIHEMEDFVMNCQAHEKIILQRYVDRCSKFHAIITVINYLTAGIVICAPLLLPQPFPTKAVYPFRTDSILAICLVYAHQSFVGIQCSTGATIDCQTALMMWYAGARIEILAGELKEVSDVEGFKTFVRKHQRLLSYAKEVSVTMSNIALVTLAMSGVGTIFSSLQLLGITALTVVAHCLTFAIVYRSKNQPIAVKMQFGPVAVIAAMNLFVCAWPADNLITVCDMMGKAVYNTSWTDASPMMMKNFLIVLRRCQEPVTVSVRCFLPTLSLRYYATYLSTAFSYTTTLRLIIKADPETRHADY